MDINESILYIGNLVYANGSNEDRDAWQTLKTAVLAQQSAAPCNSAYYSGGNWFPGAAG